MKLEIRQQEQFQRCIPMTCMLHIFLMLQMMNLYFKDNKPGTMTFEYQFIAI